jgi:2-polyprenyl-3-methyl-5-hydroxy-6-metoxy-1,4-benzoquinol methylase
MGADLSEWHSGYRAYSVAALRQIPFERNSDGFDFDTEVIVQLFEAGMRIAEIPIPTYYGDEISHVNGLRYAWDIVGDVTRYRLHKMGFGSGELAFASEPYEEKSSADASHALVVRRVTGRPGGPGRVLDLGCGDGSVSARLRAAGWEVTGVDLEESPGVSSRVDRFVKADLDLGLPSELADGGGFDVVLAADVLEHVREPERLLDQLHSLVSPGGVVLASIPNVAHWYVRARVLLGRWDYDRRGILDRTHLRFFTRRSFTRVAERSGWQVARVEATGLPFDVVDRGGEGQSASVRRLVGRIDRAGVAVWPTLFGYQFLFELRPGG